MNRAGYRVVVATNQSGIARGIFDEAFVAKAHRHIADVLDAGGAHVDGFYYCPHHPEGTVAQYTRGAAIAGSRSRACCGRPRASSTSISRDPGSSAIAGTTLQAGTAVGARGLLVRTGYGREAERTTGVGAAGIVDDLIAAASWILRTS